MSSSSSLLCLFVKCEWKHYVDALLIFCRPIFYDIFFRLLFSWGTKRAIKEKYNKMKNYERGKFLLKAHLTHLLIAFLRFYLSLSEFLYLFIFEHESLCFLSFNPGNYKVSSSFLLPDALNATVNACFCNLWTEL